MGFTKLDNIGSENRFFLDRIDILDNIEKDILHYKENPCFYKLISFYGMGGIGKTRLINEIYKKYSGTDLELFKVPLEILNQETIPSILLFIRNMFSSTPRFDYVLLRYWEFYHFDKVSREKFDGFIKKAVKLVANRIDSRLLCGNYVLEYIANEVIGLYETFVISEKQKKLVPKLIQDKTENLYHYMIEMLVEDIEFEMNGQYYMFIFDAYRINNERNRIDWLKHFINLFHHGIFITTSREPLEWFEDKNIDDTMCASIPINTIPSDIIEEHLSKSNFTQREIDIILKKTDCIPLFLDLALNISENSKIDESTFIGFQCKEDLIKNFLSHLSREEQTIIEYLAVVKLFSREIYENVLDYNNLSPQIYCFEDFKQSTIIRYTEEHNGLYKIHSVLSSNISYLVRNDIKYRIINNYINFLSTRLINDIMLDDDAKYNCILNVYELIEKENVPVEEYIIEKLLDMYFYLSDKNYENDFSKFFDNLSKKEDSPLKYIYIYIEAKSLRKNNIKKGLRKLEDIPFDKCNFGKHIKSLQCDINYLLSILGNYNMAEQKMSAFVLSLKQNEVGERYYIKGHIYNCDMQMLRGNFKESVANLTELSNNLVEDKVLYEIKKAIGHNYRFNFLLDKALLFYSECKMEEDKAYYYTVQCESECYFKFQSVLNYYLEAIAENKRYGNHNNLGKIYYSVAIAKILQKDYASAQRYIEKAYSEFRKTCYQAGNLFVMITEEYLKYSKNGTISSKSIKKIKKQIDKLDGIYEYLLLPLYVAKKDHKKISEFKDKFAWFSYEETIENVNKFIHQLKN